MKHRLDNPALNIALFALLLSLPWEFGQMWFYAGAAEISHLRGIAICMAATVGDAAIMLLAFAGVSISARSQDRVHAPQRSQVVAFLLMGLITTLAIEFVATRTDSDFGWRYAPSMPVTPVLSIGLVPLLMWVVVPLLTLWFVRRQILQY